MVQIVGKYQHEKNENLDDYFKACGVPYIPRKMMQSSSPSLEITCDENGKWKITNASLFRTVVLEFTLGEEYEEHMPGGVIIKSTTTKEGDKLFTVSIAPDQNRITRTYEFNDTHCIITLKHEKSGVEAKRFFKRI